MNSQIRPATAGDAAAISQVIIQSLRQSNAQDYSPEVIAQVEQSFSPEAVCALLSQRQVFVATLNYCVVATASLDGDVVRSVFVDPSHQGRGLGKQLMAMIESTAIDAKFAVLRVPSSITAEGFYTKLGFRKIRDEFHGAERTIIMEWHLIPIVDYSDEHHRTSAIELWQAAFGYETAHNTPSLVIDKKLAVADGLFFVALAGKVVVGTVLAGYDGHRGWLYSVAVHPSQRRKGLGARLVRHAEQALTVRGCVKINLQIVSANASVKAFYEALGYSVEPRISMGKKVESNIPLLAD
jgi:ribosomal protein S18 acetylase RimI-like enzyme